METTLRQAMKAVTWQLTGLVVMTLLGRLITGSWSVGGAFALSGAATGLFSYVLHEKLWARIRWGKITERGQI